MSKAELVKQWDESALLNAEFEQLYDVLSRRQFTMAQISRCFKILIVDLVVDIDDEVHIDDFRSELQALLSNESEILEMCMGLVHVSEQPGKETLDDVIREYENRLWQEE